MSADMARTYSEHESAGRPRQVRGGSALAIEAEGGDAGRGSVHESAARASRGNARSLSNENFPCEYAPVGSSLGAIGDGAGDCVGE